MQNLVTSVIDKDQERIKKLRLLDDDFMKLVFNENTKATTLLLNVYLIELI